MDFKNFQKQRETETAVKLELFEDGDVFECCGSFFQVTRHGIVNWNGESVDIEFFLPKIVTFIKNNPP